MGRQKKNELDVILEQLKKSYAADSEDALDEKSDGAEGSEEDVELSSVLERIFSEADNTVACENGAETHDEERDDKTLTEINIDESPENDMESTVITDKSDSEQNEIICESEGIKEAPSSVEASVVQEDIGTDNDLYTEGIDAECQEESAAPDDACAGESVDAVFKAMFPQMYSSDDKDKNKSDHDDTDDHHTDLEREVEKELDSKEKSSDSPTVVTISEKPESQEDVIEIDDGAARLDEVSNDADIFGGESEVEAVFDLDETDDVPQDDNRPQEDQQSDMVIERQSDPITEEDELTELVPHIILSPDEYVGDALQCDLSLLEFYYPQDEIRFKRKSAEEEVPEDTKTPTPVSHDVALDDNDISLLLRFGYNGELDTEIGEEQTRRVIVDESSKYIPEPHNVTHGFCGKEFTGTTQTVAIKKKYRQDKTFLLLETIFSMLFALIMIVTDIAIPFLMNKAEYLMIIFIEVAVIIVMMALLAKKLWSGILGILKFNVNAYSVLAVIIAGYLTYCISIFIVYAVNSRLLFDVDILFFGGCIMLYIALTVLAELLDCCREMNVFRAMVDSKGHYTLEKQGGRDSIATNEGERYGLYDSEEVYKVRKSNYLSSYFKKSCEKSSDGAHPIYLLALIPTIMVAVCYSVAMIRESVMHGLNAALTTILLSIPVSSVCAAAFIEFTAHNKLKKKKIFTCGYSAANELSEVKTIVFSDVDAIEITSYTEINPDKSNEKTKKWINLTNQIFSALGGALSEIVLSKMSAESNVDHDVVINSISENGIDVYFDSSMNVLVGDRQYLLSKGIKVKTDTTLTAATKGVERSVIYVVFDGVPRIGFILNSRIKGSFLSIIAALEEYEIKSIVESYEPQTNDYYFEKNKGNCETPVTVYKPPYYERPGCRAICDGVLISETLLGVSEAIFQSKKTIEARKMSRRIGIWQTIVGFLTSLILCIITNVFYKLPVFTFIQRYHIVFFYATLILCFIPSIICAVKVGGTKQKKGTDK